MKTIRPALLAAAAVAAWLPGQALAQTETPAPTTTQEPEADAASGERNVGYVDLSASLGYSRNPFLAPEPDGSVFARGSAYAVYQLNSERSNTDLSAFAESSFYFGDRSTQLGRLSAQHNYAASESTSVFGGVSFSADRGSQLSNRFLTLPGQGPDEPDVIIDPALFGTDTRSYRLSGNVGATFRISERDTLSLSAQDEQVWYDGSAATSNFNTVSAQAVWNRQLTERSSFGATASGQYVNYSDPGESNQVYTLQGTLSRYLTENWQARVGAGASLVMRKTPLIDDNSVSPAVDVSLCRQTALNSFCGDFSHGVQTSIGEARKSTQLGLNYSSRLSARDSVSAGATLARYKGGLVSTTDYYLSAAASYNRRFSGRFSGGLNLSARDRFRKNSENVPFDLSGSVSINYRIGDLPR